MANWELLQNDDLKKKPGLLKIQATIIGFTAFIVLTNAALASDTKTPEVYGIEDVVVCAEDNRAYVEDTVTENEISKAVLSDSVLESLQNLPGVKLRRTSVAGNENGKLRIRGFNETRLRILKDGVPIQRDGSYGNGPLDWSTIPASGVERIEIHRGAGPAKFGNTIGGVVNIISKKPSDDIETSLTLSGGSNNTQKYGILNKGSFGPAGWILSLGRFDTDGYLKNNYVERNSFSADFFFTLPFKTEVGAGISYSDIETGMPVYNRPDSPYYNGSDPDSDERELGGPGIGSRLNNGAMTWGDGSFADDENMRIKAWILHKFKQGQARLDFMQWSQDTSEKYYDAADSNKKIYERKTNAEPDNWSLQAEAVYQLANHRIEAGGETRSYGWGAQDVKYIDESYFNGSINSPFFAFIRNGFKGQSDILEYHALYLQDDWKIRSDFDLELGLRQEWFKANEINPDAFGFTWTTEKTTLDDSNLDPRIALKYRPWDKTSFSARFGIVHRYPNSPEYFWWYLNKGTGFFNTDFNSEKALQYELAYDQSFADLMNFQIRTYYYDVEDYISSTFVPGTGNVYYNIKEVTVRGAEIGFNIKLPYNFKTWANFTYQKGDKKNDPWDSKNILESQLPDFPETMFNTGLDYSYKDIFSAKIALNHVGKREHMSENLIEKLGSYTTLNGAFSFIFLEKSHSKWKFNFTAENILDKNYEEEEGYPMPGATIIAGITADF